MQLHQTIKTLKEEAIKNADGKDFTFGEALSNILLGAKEGGKMKMFILATKCFNDKEIKLDNADLSLIKKTVESTEIYGNLVTGQLLIALEDEKSA
jgi:hypothetical protein